VSSPLDSGGSGEVRGMVGGGAVSVNASMEEWPQSSVTQTKGNGGGGAW
jgi:hypothetical protein